MKITEWLLSTRWEKTVILEIVILLVLIICNLLLFIGASRQSPVELLPWLASHGVFFGVQVILIVYYMVTIFITTTPSTQVATIIQRMIYNPNENFQNQWMGLPQGMTSKNPEFQQKLRWSLGVNVGKLTALVITSMLTAF